MFNKCCSFHLVTLIASSFFAPASLPHSIFSRLAPNVTSFYFVHLLLLRFLLPPFCITFLYLTLFRSNPWLPTTLNPQLKTFLVTFTLSCTTFLQDISFSPTCSIITLHSSLTNHLVTFTTSTSSSIVSATPLLLRFNTCLVFILCFFSAKCSLIKSCYIFFLLDLAFISHLLF